MSLRLHDYAASGNCYKVRLLLAQLDREYERVPVDIFAGDTLTEEFGRLNPVRETPVLEEDGADPLPESNAILLHLADKQLGPLKRTASLLLGDLKDEAGARLVLGVCGGVLAPLAVARFADAGDASHGALILAALGLAALVAAELVERALFFRAASPPRMPGGV